MYLSTAHLMMDTKTYSARYYLLLCIVDASHVVRWKNVMLVNQE
jgi:hypothetical protein